MIQYKKQTRRTTKEDQAENINIYSLNGFEFGVVTSNYWGNFNDKKEADKYHKEHSEKNPLIELTLDNIHYEYTLEEFKQLLRDGMKTPEIKNIINKLSIKTK